jgi:RNA polymerase sigma factor (sigma-70 family)
MNTDTQYHTDEVLLEGIRNEEDQAFRELYLRYFPMIHHLIMKNSGQLDDAKDIFQEMIIQLFINIRDRDFILTSRLSTYMYSIARNKWRERLRKNARTDLVSMVDTQTDHQEITELSDIETTGEQIEIMEKLMEHLTDECQKILRFFYFSRFSLEEIARKMNYTYEFAKQKKSRCLNKLRSLASTHWPES